MAEQQQNAEGIPPPPPQGGGADFNRMMQQAAAIKSQQVRAARRKFESTPPFVQHSLYFQEPESIEPRSLPYAQRMEKAQLIKEAGNAAFKGKDYQGAIARYERALGCFTWFVSKDPDWKTNGIKDENLELIRYGGENDEEKAEIKNFEISLLNNMAASFMQLKVWEMCGALSSDVLRRDPQNAKARYRRAVALSSRPQSGAKEIDMAINDLEQASKVDSDDKKIKLLKAKLLKQREVQQKKEKETFGGVFNRGEIVEEKPKKPAKLLSPEELAAKIDKSKSPMIQQIELLEAMMKQAHAAGKNDEALNLAQHVKTMKEAHAELHKQDKLEGDRPDYRNPTKQMILEAAQFNIDLKDPRIILELERLERAKLTENGDITDLQAKEDAELLAAAQMGGTDTQAAWLKKNRLAIGILVSVLIMIAVVVMSSPIEKPAIVLPDAEATADAGVHDEI